MSKMRLHLRDSATMKRAWTSVLCMALIAGAAGCSGSEVVQGPERKQNTVESLLDSVKAALTEDRPTVAGYRNAVQQLNSYLDQKKDPPEKFKLPVAARDIVVSQVLKDARGTPALVWERR